MKILKELVKVQISTWKSKGKQKIFCIGRNKTGTTSIKKALELNGFVVGNQRKASSLIDSYLAKDFEPIIKYCNTAQAFQDAPFSYPDTFKYLDKAFPNSKFILSIRESSDVWYQSFIKYHSNKFNGGRLPDRNSLMISDYVYHGWIWKSYKSQFGEDHALYNREHLINTYERYNNDVIDYFRRNLDQLLIIDISKKDAYTDFCTFLNVTSNLNDFPWENRGSLE